MNFIISLKYIYMYFNLHRSIKVRTIQLSSTNATNVNAWIKYWHITIGNGVYRSAHIICIILCVYRSVVSATSSRKHDGR